MRSNSISCIRPLLVNIYFYWQPFAPLCSSFATRAAMWQWQRTCAIARDQSVVGERTSRGEQVNMSTYSDGALDWDRSGTLRDHSEIPQLHNYNPASRFLVDLCAHRFNATVDLCLTTNAAKAASLTSNSAGVPSVTCVSPQILPGWHR